MCLVLAMVASPVCSFRQAAAYVNPPQLVAGVDYNKPNYANSPILTKFVDSLPRVGSGTPSTLNGYYIPVAVADHATFSGTDYYVIAVVEYAQKMHRELNPTKLRGYVQIEDPQSGSGTPPGSRHIALTDASGAPILYNGRQVYGYDDPRYLGPIIQATRGTATRIKFYNLLPTTANGGNLFLPTDTTIMGAGTGPNGANYPQNRADLHLHGGDNPWISDGTPHQWITPMGEAGTLLKGVSQKNVPDMPVPPSGAATLYWPNGQSGRLMFYHDHSYGVTRLNVYAGEAAGYLLTDPSERAINSLISGSEIPLIIQDKTFVSDGTAPAAFAGLGTATQATTAVDPLWASNPAWGQTKGALWFPHVYMPNQNPNDLSGANPFGRWDYGAWFWPIFPSGIPPQTSSVPESFLDTPVVNGLAYPYLEVDPKAYRFRVLNAANDRYLNLQLYVADPTATGAGAGKEVRTIPAVKGAADGTGNFPAAGAYDAAPVYWPSWWIANDTPGMIPNVLDNRAGGVPDPSPSLMGPDIIHIGSEGGIAPEPVTLQNTPMGYEQNKRSVTVLNTMEHTLFLGPAERADVIIDFSQYAGKTLILYNDAPAPVPAGDPRNDYYTGSPDLQSMGGAPPAVAGFGPNIRTIMQIRVSGTVGANGTAFDPTVLDAPMAAAFAATQPQPIVPETAYTAASGPPPSGADTYARISDTSLSYTPYGAASPIVKPLEPKTIQELFDPLGRMNSTLGVEMPFTTSLIQTTIPLGYIDPATEIIPDDGTQLWKITHNGVDTHAIHFHLFNVQLINRVGWDGAIKPPSPEEVGWKETVKMNPLEDVVVALKAKVPTVPFRVLSSKRLLDPTMPLGSTMGFANVTPTNTPVTVTNQLANFGNEYVWHCHLLGHEENDMMRPILVAAAPVAPLSLSASYNGSAMVLTWQNVDAGVGTFTVQRASNSAFTTGLVQFTVPVVPGTNNYSYSDTTFNPSVIPNYYRVFATGTVGSGVAGYPSQTVTSGYSNVLGPPTTAITLNPAAQAAAAGSPVVLNWSATGTLPDVFRVQRATNSSFTAGLTQAGVNKGNPTTYSFPASSMTPGRTYYFRILPANLYGNGNSSNTVSFTPHS